VNLIPKPYQRDHKPFQKRLDRKQQQERGRRDQTAQRLCLSLRKLSPNPIGVITSLFKKGLTEKPE